MPTAPEINLRLYEELSDFLPADKRKRRFACPLNGISTVGQLLASLGVPANQVELVLVNGISSGCSHRLKAGDYVSLYPVFEAFDVTSLVRLRGRSLRQTRFIAGRGLVRLSRYLRLLGFDVLDSGVLTLKEIVDAAEKERRILLTKDPAWAERRSVSRICLLRSAAPIRQLAEVLSRFDLYESAQISGLKPGIEFAPRPGAGNP